MKTFVFNTERGDGIPGIPSEITEEEARELGVEKLLADAVASGAYVPQEQDRAPVEKPVPTGARSSRPSKGEKEQE